MNDLRAALHALLKPRLAAVAEGYDRFAAGEAPDDAKGFAAHHAACRAALAHLDLLLRLLRWAEAEEVGAAGDEAASLLAAARAALADYDEDA